MNKYIYTAIGVAILGGAFVLSVTTDKGKDIAEEGLGSGEVIIGTNSEKFLQQEDSLEARIMLTGFDTTQEVSNKFPDYKCDGNPRTWSDYARFKEFEEGTLIEVAHKDCGKNSRLSHTTLSELSDWEEHFGEENIIMKLEGRKIIEDLSDNILE